MTTFKDSNKLFVGCQVTTVTEDQIRGLFADIEDVGEIIICRDKNHLCKGFAFISIGGSQTNFNKALNKKVQLEGRLLDISVAHGLEMRNNIIQKQREHKIFVKNLPLEINDEKLEKQFQKYGKIKKAYVIYHFSTNISKRYGYVEFMKKETVDKALQVHKFKVYGREVLVSRFVPRSEQQIKVKPKNNFDFEKFDFENMNSLINDDYQNFVNQNLLYMNEQENIEASYQDNYSTAMNHTSAPTQEGQSYAGNGYYQQTENDYASQNYYGNVYPQQPQNFEQVQTTDGQQAYYSPTNCNEQYQNNQGYYPENQSTVAYNNGSEDYNQYSYNYQNDARRTQSAEFNNEYAVTNTYYPNAHENFYEPQQAYYEPQQTGIYGGSPTYNDQKNCSNSDQPTYESEHSCDSNKNEGIAGFRNFSEGQYYCSTGYY